MHNCLSSSKTDLLSHWTFENYPKLSSVGHFQSEQAFTPPTHFRTLFGFSEKFGNWQPPLIPYNVWFFWVSRHRSIILAKKMETFSGRFWEIPGNVRKLELSKTLVDHKNALVFYQVVSGKSSWSFFFTGEPNTNKENSDKASVHCAFSRLKRKTRLFFRRFFRLSANFRPHSCAIFHPNTHIIFFCPLSAYDEWWFEQKKSPHFRENYLVLSYLNCQRYKRRGLLKPQECSTESGALTQIRQ